MHYGQTRAQWPCGASCGSGHHYSLFCSWGVPAFSCLFCQVFDKPMEKKKSCLSPAWYLYHVLQSHWAYPTCREQQQFLAVPSLHQKDCKWSRDVSKWESHACAQVALAASQHVNCLLTWTEKAIKILLGLWASLSRGALLKPRWDWLCPRKYHKCKR